MTTNHPRRILMLGATGTIGRATVTALVRRGHAVVAFVRPGSVKIDTGAIYRYGNVTDTASLSRDGLCNEKFDVMVSCLASRTGATEDAWRIDHQAHIDALAASKKAGVKHFVLLSAICVQRPRLAFQHAKLAFEKVLIESGMIYSIVRPTAFFKSLSGQVERVRKGKPFLLFGDGKLTACKPISDDDLAEYLADCVDDPNLHNRILPIGGPGSAITPRQQGEMLFELLAKPPRFRHVPVRLLDLIISGLNITGRLIPAAGKKAEFARIGRYYATESMLVLNSQTGSYEEEATPSTGSTTLRDYYRCLIEGKAHAQRGEHSVF